MELLTTTINTPSGDKYVIRETTGADDDRLSNLSLDPSDIIHNYLLYIIQSKNGVKVVLGDIEKMKLRDKYSILIQSRIFSLGKMLSFSYDWPTGKEEYEVDLTDYVWDYSKPFPEEGHPDYFSERIKPYPEDPNINRVLSNGLEIKMDFLTGEGEKYLLNLTPDKRTINRKLIARNLMIKDENGAFVPVKSFDNISSRVSNEIRNICEKEDPDINGWVFISNPQTMENLTISLLEIRDFFFPTKI
jgi:hypothetical protein